VCWWVVGDQRERTLEVIGAGRQVAALDATTEQSLNAAGARARELEQELRSAQSRLSDANADAELVARWMERKRTSYSLCFSCWLSTISCVLCSACGVDSPGGRESSAQLAHYFSVAGSGLGDLQMGSGRHRARAGTSSEPPLPGSFRGSVDAQDQDSAVLSRRRSHAPVRCRRSLDVRSAAGSPAIVPVLCHS